MCGITGFIGHSKNKELSNKLITDLFAECETRGEDAAGFWAVEKAGQDSNAIYYHKEPGKASDLVKKQAWTDLCFTDVDLLIAHARGASTGVGGPHVNKNNHPFISADKSIGLIHNGRIHEYDDLVKQYEVSSSCDSEILLRIFEGGHNYEENQISLNLKENHDELMTKRLMGLKDIWSFVDRGHMAVAIGERVNAFDRRLFLFRNKHRPLWIADCVKDLGQIFFISTPEIWTSAYKSSGAFKQMKNTVRLIEVPTEQLWVLNISEKSPVVKSIGKYTIKSTGKTTWEPSEKIKIHRGDGKGNVSLISRLNEKEEVKTYDHLKKNIPNNPTVGFASSAAAGNDKKQLSSVVKSPDLADKKEVKKQLVQDFSGDSSSATYKLLNESKYTNILYEITRLEEMLKNKIDNLASLFRSNYRAEAFSEAEAIEHLGLIENLEAEIESVTFIVNKNDDINPSEEDTVLDYYD